MNKRRRPTRIEYTKTVHFGSRPPAKKSWPWPSIGAGVLAVVILPREPLLSLVICAVAIYLWRRNVRVSR
jgi:hypothetical protein